ncbi:hypothetical protein ACFO5X_12845 [Seohaeicola nanhaiensis]|uniref:YgiT-type zinc finger protein n=1 Tax=Seohaeicola nanhaiensis TaxID=1387282 RepID=A0ABV9KHL1_9RHOB
MAAPFRPNRHTNRSTSCTTEQTWLCSKCFMKLGHLNEQRVEICFARGHQYVVSIPVTAVCRNCGKLNELR